MIEIMRYKGGQYHKISRSNKNEPEVYGRLPLELPVILLHEVICLYFDSDAMV
jgi:hypothetical protein